MIWKQQVEAIIKARGQCMVWSTQRQRNLPFLCSKVLVWYGLLFGLGFNSAELGSAHQSWIRSCFLVSDFVYVTSYKRKGSESYWKYLSELSIASSTSDDGSEMRAKGGCDWKGASD
ncbi:hypothetical protein MTR_6g017180 [Medicago truncatula]|uniref:Uncharacterized protein n=1 Tax=Medicago truncatula TaxID=3880 RepID=A0A072UHQ3_MEDTR|nr:hypothetical protein MTR_6g017180 [Medicago truncatula]